MNRTSVHTAAILLGAILNVTPATAQDGFRAVVEFQRNTAAGSPETRTAEFISGGDHVRFNSAQDGQRVSMVWGPDTSLMIHHTRRMYIQMPTVRPNRRPPSEPQTAQPTSTTESTECVHRSLRPSGREDTIHGQSVREIQAVDGSRICLSFWVSRGAGFGLIEVFRSMAAEMTRMIGQAGQAASFARQFERLRRLGRLPPYRILRMHNPERQTTVTLVRSTRERIPPSEFSPPAGYTQQRLPTPGAYPRPPIPPG